jgi:hypothetical protein
MSGMSAKWLAGFKSFFVGHSGGLAMGKIEFSAKPIFSKTAQGGNRLLVEFRVTNRGEPALDIKRWGVRTTNLQAVWVALFPLENIVLKKDSSHSATEEIADEVAKAIMTGAEAFCDNGESVVAIPLIVPVVPLGQTLRRPF